MTEWEWLYASGRLQKPVSLLNQATGGTRTLLNNALQYNLESAVLCSLLLLNKMEVTEWELFLEITGLSYMGKAFMDNSSLFIVSFFCGWIGDFRMTIGEDRNKVENILIPAVGDFRKLYAPVFDQFLTQRLDKDHTYNVKVKYTCIIKI